MIPHDGQGKPDNIFKGQNDWSDFKWSLSLVNLNIKGSISVMNAPILP